MIMNISDANGDGIAMDGFDPVAYYNNEPLKGQKRYQFSIGDYTYQFANAENMQDFQKEPSKYIPIAGSYTSEKMVGNMDVMSDKNHYIGNKTLNTRRQLDDAIEASSRKLPNDIKEDGSMEMQNLHDSNN